MMTVTPDDPWADLAAPSSAEVINARRVDPDVAWNFFWGRDIDNKCLLVLRHSPDSAPTGRLPRLRGMEVSLSGSDTQGDQALIFRLTESAHQDIFHRLCLDIMGSATRATTEKEAVDISLARTWRWHHLLRGGGDDRLSPEEQKGLMGELLLLERYLLPHLPPSEAVAAWRGPLGAPKDFEIGKISIEVKARRGAATPFVTISSEHQLDSSGSDAVYLYVVELGQAPADTDGAFTVTDVAQRVSGILASDGSALTAFESELLAAGFKWADDYSDYSWVEGSGRFYRVSQDFPRITAEQIGSGVSDVRYSISLVACEPFAVPVEVVQQSLLGGSDVDGA
ncbi:MAG: PD-(D/E)XK motif protein [Dehalococcoidia bacterium]|nr:PD-(D/E)XK motif protein [Dehalococcoidia bacterium]